MHHSVLFVFSPAFRWNTADITINEHAFQRTCTLYNKLMNVAIIGCGYVGLVTAATLADKGNTVACVDVDFEKITMLQKGMVPIKEPGLDKLIQKNMQKDRLHFMHTLDVAVSAAQYIIICVGTPILPSGAYDVSYVEEVARNIALSCKPDDPKIVIIKSTVPVGTAHRVKKILREHNSYTEFFVASNPEFLREGVAIADAFSPDRIVIGGDGWQTSMNVTELYANFDCRIIHTDNDSAEMIKLASNAFLATKISFINSIAQLCDKVGGNVNEVARGMGYDPRIGDKFLQAGLGYGGSCLPKDTKALIYAAEEAGVNFDILKAVDRVNEQQTELFFQRIKDRLGDLNGKTLGFWGVSFKPDTDDLRDSKAIQLMRWLIDAGAKINVYDEWATPYAKRALPQIQCFPTPYEVVFKADALVIATEAAAFRKLDLAQAKQYMNTPIVFDGRNLFDPSEMKSQGFDYISIGRPD